MPPVAQEGTTILLVVVEVVVVLEKAMEMLFVEEAFSSHVEKKRNEGNEG